MRCGVLLLSCLLLTGCGKGGERNVTSLKPLSGGKADLAFNCAHETIPVAWPDIGGICRN